MMAEPCVGCGAGLPALEGPVHRYMTSSPACWAAFGRVLAAEYSDLRLMPVHRLTVDAYAVQHPGDGSRQAVQSVGLHLARLQVQLERQLNPAEANAFMLRAGRQKATLPALPPPPLVPFTIADVAPYAGTARHIEVVAKWAQSAWESWDQAHEFIRKFTASILQE